MFGVSASSSEHHLLHLVHFLHLKKLHIPPWTDDRHANLWESVLHYYLSGLHLDPSGIPCGLGLSYFSALRFSCLVSCI